MPIEAEEVFSPGWWLLRLESELRARREGHRSWTARRTKKRQGRPSLQLLDDYMAGNPPLQHAANEWADTMRAFLRLSRLNVAELVAEAPRERMIPLGFRTAADSDENGDEVAAGIMRANDLELVFGDIYGYMLQMGDGYAIAGKDEGAADDEAPLITAEDPRECITAQDSATKKTLAALKMYCDEWTGEERAVLYLPGVVFHASSGGGGLRTLRSRGADGWDWDGDPREWPTGLEDLVPVFRFQNRRGMGEFEPHLDVLDRINDQIFGRLVIAKFQAFKQRAVMNLPERDEKGNVVDYDEVFISDPGAMWRVPDGVEFWESGEVQLQPLLSAAKDDLQQIAAVTRTPLYFITPDAANGSAEGAATAREGLIYRTMDRRRRADAGNGRLMSAGFRMMGAAERSDRMKIRTMWAPLERYSLDQRASAASQAAAGGLPWKRIMTEIWQFTPDELREMQTQRDEDVDFDAKRAAKIAAAEHPPTVPQFIEPPAA